MSFGKSSSTTTPTLTQEQKDQIAAQTGFLTGTIIPTYTGAVKGATDIYGQSSGGVQNAAQNLAGTASQAQQTLGSTGESALNTGVSGLESLFSPDYEANQIATALQPAQAQYMQNLANQNATFGGAGELGSARQALADRALAGATMATQANTAAQVQKDIAAQRAATGANLAQIGQTGLTGAQTAAGNVVTASMTPQDFYNKYASIIFGTPSSSYNANFTGTQGQTKTGTSMGIQI
jgi:hypothetical protein